MQYERIRIMLIEIMIILLFMITLIGRSIFKRRSLKFLLITFCFSLSIFSNSESSNLNAAPWGRVIKSLPNVLKNKNVRKGVSPAQLVRTIDISKLGPAPIKVATKSSFFDSTTKVIRITNMKPEEHLDLHIVVENKKTKQVATHVFKVAPGETYEIGSMQIPWKLKSGDTYTIKSSSLSFLGTITETIP